MTPARDVEIVISHASAPMACIGADDAVMCCNAAFEAFLENAGHAVSPGAPLPVALDSGIMDGARIEALSGGCRLISVPLSGDAGAGRESRLKAIMDTVVDAIITIDDRGRIETFNKAAERMFGYAAHEVCGQNVSVLMPEAAARLHDRQLGDYQDTGQAKVIGIGREDTGRRKSGALFPMDLSVSEMWIDDRRFYAGVVRDITERKAAQRALRASEERYALAMQGTNDGLWDWSLVENRIYASSRCCEILSRNAAELATPKGWEKVIHPDDYTLYRKELVSHLRGETDFLFAEFRVVPAVERDEAEQWVRLRGALQRDASGRAARMAGSLTDITERRKERERLREAKEQAELASRTKSEFLANMSHELRTPLNAVIGFSEVISNELFGPIGEPQYLSYVDNITESGRHLLDIINDILDVARIEAGAIEIEVSDVDLSMAVEAALRLIGQRAAKARVLLRRTLQPGLPRIQGDERRIKQVLLNVLSNAVKFTPEGGSIEVSLRAGDDGAQVVGIRDTGIGMSAEDIPKVMRPFGQIDSSLARRYEGTGLGLPLVKAFMDLHGGRMDIDSAEGEGTTVSLTFNPELPDVLE